MEKTLDLYITKLCNLNCEYCYVDIGHESQDFLVGKFIERKNLLEYDHIKFFGGEPLLKWKEIQMIVTSVKEKKKKMKFTIVSNGVLINQEKCDFIKKYDVSLVVSVHMIPGAQKISTQIKTIVMTLSERKYDFLFVLNQKSYAFILRDMKVLFQLGAKNFHITPDSSVLWEGEQIRFLSRSLGYLKELALKHHHVTLRFADTEKLVSDSISCKKIIYYGNGYTPCNRFTKLSYFGKELFELISQALTTAGFYETSYRYFFSCPIGYFLDHIETGISFERIAKAYIEVNLQFIKIQQEIEYIKAKETFLTLSPQVLRFNLTHQCNLRCSYCYVDFDNIHISPQEIIGILQYFLEKGNHIETVSFFGGEPLLEYGNLERVLPMIDDLYRNFGLKRPNFQIATNALLLSSEKLEQLKSYNFEIHISVGGSEGSHNLLRDRSFEKFDAVMKTLDLYSEKNIVFLLMIDEENVHFLLKNYIFLIQKGATQIHLECIFSKTRWSERAINNLKKQLILIFQYDNGRYLKDYFHRGVYDISASGSILPESLSFHGTYNFEIKKYLDTYFRILKNNL